MKEELVVGTGPEQGELPFVLAELLTKPCSAIQMHGLPSTGDSSNQHPPQSTSNPFAIVSATMGKPQLPRLAFAHLDQGLRAMHDGDRMDGHSESWKGSLPGR